MLATAYDLSVLAVVLAAAIAVAPSASADVARADVDGDGRSDEVSLTRHARFFVLRIDTGDRVFTRTVRGFSGFKASAQGEPRLVALRPLNRQRGLEIAVRVWHSASRDFLVWYTLHRGRLVAMTGGPRYGSEPPSVWVLGGTVGTGTSSADCVKRAQIGVLDWWRYRGRSHTRLTLFAVRATRFVRVSVYELASESPMPSLPRDWPRVKRLAFGSCGGIKLGR
jgi:hypothetical protein